MSLSFRSLSKQVMKGGKAEYNISGTLYRVHKNLKERRNRMFSKKRKSLVWLLALCFLLSQIITSPIFAQSTGTDRISGADRYKTAVAVSQKGWKTSDYAVLARGDNFADALCAGPLAQKYGGPILLTQPTKLNSDTLKELQRLGVKHLFIAGGVGAISQSVENSLQANGIETIERIYGNDRYETSVKIAEKIGDSSKVVLATGSDFPDALSISGIAAKLGMPILLTSKNSLPIGVGNYLQTNTVTHTYIVGGTGVISSQVADSVPSPSRLAGSDRYETNKVIMQNFANELNFENIYVAVGSQFADALTGAVLAAKSSAPLVLTGKTLPKGTADYLQTKLKLATKVKGLGGKNAVPSSILTGLVAAKEQISVEEKYSTAGTYGPETGTKTIQGSVIISSADVILKNTIIEGDLLLGHSIGDGDVELRDVTVKGKTIINGGGPNSVIMYNFNGQTVVVDVPDGANVRLVAQGSTSVNNVAMEGNGSLDQSDVTGTGFVTVEIPAGAQVTLNGDFNEVNVEAAGANVTVASGTITTMNISSTASGAGVNLASGSSVGTLNANAQSNVTGQGQITTANINVNGVSIAQTPTNINLAPETKSNVGGQELENTNTQPQQNQSNDSGWSTVSISAVNVINATTISFKSIVVDSIKIGDVNVSMSGSAAPFASYNSTEGTYTVTLSSSSPLQVGANSIVVSKNGYNNGTAIAHYAGIAVNDAQSLEDAIENVANGESIVLAAGEYQLTETLEITKSISILGPQANVDPRPTVSSARTDDAIEAILTGDNGDDSDPISKSDAVSKGWLSSIIEIKAHNVTLNGLTIERASNYMVYSDSVESDSGSEDVTGLQIINNIVRQGRGNEGIKVGDTIDSLVQHNYITDIRYGGDAIEAYGVQGFRILENEIDGCESVNGNIRVSNTAGGEDGIIRGNIIKNTSYHFAINAEDGTGNIVIDNNDIQNAEAGGIFVYKNAVERISITNNEIDNYATTPVIGTGYKESYLRNGAAAISISYNLRDDVTQPAVTITGNITSNGTDSIPVICFGGGTSDASAIPTDLSKVVINNNSFDNPYIKDIKGRGLFTAENNSVPYNTDLNQTITDAADKTIILLAEGNYELAGGIVPNKSIMLIGYDKATTIIDTTNQGTYGAFQATNDHKLALRNMTLKTDDPTNIVARNGRYVVGTGLNTGSTAILIQNCIIDGYYTPVYMNNVNTNNNKLNIKNNIIINCDWAYSIDNITPGAQDIDTENIVFDGNTGAGAEKGREIFTSALLVGSDGASKGGHSTIPAAISAAIAGDTIKVAPAIYEITTPLNINKAITVEGYNRETVILKGAANIGNTVSISSGATLKRVTVTRDNSGVWADNVNNSLVAFGQNLSSETTLENCIIKHGRNGVYLNNTANAVIKDNLIDNNRTGIQMANSACARVENNIITNNHTMGVLLQWLSADNYGIPTFTGNTIQNNWYSDFENRWPTRDPQYNVNLSGNTFTDSTSTIADSSGEPGYNDLHPVELGGDAVRPTERFTFVMKTDGNIIFTQPLTINI